MNHSSLKSVLADWSGSGSHVDFGKRESVPLKAGRFLGHGANGAVHATTVRGVAVAWKKVFCRKAIGLDERKEIEILKKLSHNHIVKLVGTYTHGNYLGLLLWPVAVCDLQTLYEDVENLREKSFRSGELDDIWKRSCALGLTSETNFCHRLRPVGIFHAVRGGLFATIGCIVSAINYLHGQQIRHKDLKPSNILLGPRGVWVTDFGSSTDFSMLTRSTTNNGERGTPKYSSPEVVEYLPSGRKADVFSLGCLLLEIVVFCNWGTLAGLREQCPSKDRSYQANLERVNSWLSLVRALPDASYWQRMFRNSEIDSSFNSPDVSVLLGKMLRQEASERPTAGEVRAELRSKSRSQWDVQTLHYVCCAPQPAYQAWDEAVRCQSSG